MITWIDSRKTLPFRIHLYCDASVKDDSASAAWLVTNQAKKPIYYGMKILNPNLSSGLAEIFSLILGLQSIPTYRHVGIYTDCVLPVEAFKENREIKVMEKFKRSFKKQVLVKPWEDLIFVASRHIVKWNYQPDKYCKEMRFCHNMCKDGLNYGKFLDLLKA